MREINCTLLSERKHDKKYNYRLLKSKADDKSCNPLNLNITTTKQTKIEILYKYSNLLLNEIQLDIYLKFIIYTNPKSNKFYFMQMVLFFSLLLLFLSKFLFKNLS